MSVQDAFDRDAAGNLAYVINCSGKSGFNSPKLSVNGGIDQTFELGGVDVVATVDGRYRSNRVIGFEFIAQEMSGSDFTADASLTVSDHAKRFSLTGYVRNFTNRTVPVLAQFQGSTGNTVSTIYQAPRTYGARARFNF